MAAAGRARPTSGAVSPARASAYRVIRRVFEQSAYADRALHAAAGRLEPRDRALATQLSYGTVQRRATLDYVIAGLSDRAPATLDPPVLAALRLGLFQLLFLSGIADHAAVHDAVELIKRDRREAAGLVNAVLRRAAREGRQLLAGLDDRDSSGAAILHSVPEWLSRRWWSELGAAEARALLATVNEPAEAALRVNSLVAPAPGDVRALPVAAHAARGLPEGLVLEGPFDAHGSRLFRDGVIMPQSRGSMTVGRAVDPQPLERILDLCAAPGAKTTHLAALGSGCCDVVAVERHPGRAQALVTTCRRMHADRARVEMGDAAQPREDGPYDRVLVDPPCSGLGTLQSRPDLRWRVSERSIEELAELQRRILAAAGAATAPGGVLVYSVCTISRAEGVEVVESFLDAHPEFVPEAVGPAAWVAPPLAAPADAPPHSALSPAPSLAPTPYLQLLPHRHGTDGFFIARLRRAG